MFTKFSYIECTFIFWTYGFKLYWAVMSQAGNDSIKI